MSLSQAAEMYLHTKAKIEAFEKLLLEYKAKGDMVMVEAIEGDIAFNQRILAGFEKRMTNRA